MPSKYMKKIRKKKYWFWKSWCILHRFPHLTFIDPNTRCNLYEAIHILIHKVSGCFVKPRTDCQAYRIKSMCLLTWGLRPCSFLSRKALSASFCSRRMNFNVISSKEAWVWAYIMALSWNLDIDRKWKLHIKIILFGGGQHKQTRIIIKRLFI